MRIIVTTRVIIAQSIITKVKKSFHVTIGTCLSKTSGRHNTLSAPLLNPLFNFQGIFHAADRDDPISGVGGNGITIFSDTFLLWGAY